jgi:DNA-binding transcriptional ArsR family regulator
VDGVFEALGDPVRRLILELLATGEQSAGAIVAAVQARAPISQPAVSQHLKVLREAGFVNARAEGTRRFYALDQPGLDAAQVWLARLTDPLGSFGSFAQPLDALGTEVSRGRRSRRSAAANQPGARSGVRSGVRPGEPGSRLA